MGRYLIFLRSICVDESNGQVYVSGLTYGNFGDGYENSGKSDAFLVVFQTDDAIIPTSTFVSEEESSSSGLHIVRLQLLYIKYFSKMYWKARILMEEKWKIQTRTTIPLM
jgi:hypothetical protein